MKTKRLAIYSAVALILSFVGVRLASADGVGVPVISAPFVTVHVGDTFTIPISITNAVDLQAFQFDLSFSPTRVLAVGFTDAGTDFETAANNQGGFLVGITGFIDNVAGDFSGVADSMSGLITGTGLQGNGSLALLTFKATTPGVSPLTFSNTFLNLLDQGFDISDGQITVVPEPGSSVLLLGGLALLGGRRLARRKQRGS